MQKYKNVQHGKDRKKHIIPFCLQTTHTLFLVHWKTGKESHRSTQRWPAHWHHWWRRRRRSNVCISMDLHSLGGTFLLLVCTGTSWWNNTPAQTYILMNNNFNISHTNVKNVAVSINATFLIEWLQKKKNWPKWHSRRHSPKNNKHNWFSSSGSRKGHNWCRLWDSWNF